MNDLFAYPPSGTGSTDTSRKAGRKVHPSTQPIRSQIMELMNTGVQLTADELAHKLNLKIRSVRPRVTELFNNGDLVETRRRRQNKDGNPQIVWKIKGEDS